MIYSKLTFTSAITHLSIISKLCVKFRRTIRRRRSRKSKLSHHNATQLIIIILLIVVVVGDCGVSKVTKPKGNTMVVVKRYSCRTIVLLAGALLQFYVAQDQSNAASAFVLPMATKALSVTSTSTITSTCLSAEGKGGDYGNTKSKKPYQKICGSHGNRNMSLRFSLRSTF